MGATSGDADKNIFIKCEFRLMINYSVFRAERCGFESCNSLQKAQWLSTALI